MRVYTAGPMTDKPNYNHDAFVQLAKDLRALGHQVVSPVELDKEDGFDPTSGPDGWAKPKEYKHFLSRDIRVIAERNVQGIVVLPGWEKSKGARVEVMFGLALGLPILKLRGGELVNVVTTIERIEEALSGATD
jgi:hypothetical protein